MEEGFIKNLLTGIRQWVNGKIADINTAIEGKQDVLTAGANIEITSGGTISATDTTYVASDFDIKDLADSTGLREEWSGKQDALTAGNNIEIDSAGTISVTGVTSATEQALEDMSLVISSNINELDSRVTAVESGKQDALTAGANIEIDSANTISVTGITVPVVTDFDIKDLADSTGLRDEWSGKQDALTAGANISIDSAGTISAVDTTYVASDFDVKDLADSTGLRTTWSDKQDALTAGSGIEIDSASTISVSDTIINGAAAGATALQPNDIAEWAKQPNKPSYTPEEVGAMPADTVIIDDSDVTSGTTFSSSKIVELLGSISQFTIRVVNELPVTGETHVIYFVPAESVEASGSDVMNEYMWIENKWELIGNTRIDMSDYYTVEEVNTLLDEKLDIPDISVQDVLDELNQED